jgi:hypothetical protein
MDNREHSEGAGKARGAHVMARREGEDGLTRRGRNCLDRDLAELPARFGHESA